MASGGKRHGAGRKPGAVAPATKAAKRIEYDIAADVLREVDAKSIWKALLTCGEYKTIADVMKYLTNRVHGMPTQTIAGDKDKPLTIVLKSVNVDW